MEIDTVLEWKASSNIVKTFQDLWFLDAKNSRRQLLQKINYDHMREKSEAYQDHLIPT